ncbi:MAG: S-layer homology domain-containing protein, partial [Synergistales bacterium]|nr:S-layer homology domain-containing protein [Synergistales bacterium]
MKTRGKALTGALCALLLLVSATAATAVSRGEVVQEVVTALGLPEWGGARQYEDVPPGHPQEEAIETAAALGILLPGDHFHPDIEATRAEALGLAFLGMGWRKE